MTSRLIKGLKSAIRYARGDETAGRSTIIDVSVYKPHPVDYMGCYPDRGNIEHSGKFIPGKSRRLPRRERGSDE